MKSWILRSAQNDDPRRLNLKNRTYEPCASGGQIPNPKFCQVERSRRTGFNFPPPAPASGGQISKPGICHTELAKCPGFQF